MLRVAYFWESLRGKPQTHQLHWLLLNIRKACNMITKQMYVCSSCFVFLRLPSGLPSPLFAETLYSVGKQTDSSVMLLLFMAWWTGLIGGHSGKADRLKGEIRSGFFCFDFLRRLISEWVGWNPAADVKSREETTRYGYRLSSVLRHAPWHRLLHLSSWLPLQTAC